MTNFEWLKSQEDLKSLGHKLCDLMDYAENDGLYGCDICPVNSLCERAQNGFITWLEAEHGESEKK